MSWWFGPGLPAPSKGGGVPANALTLNGQVITLNAQPISYAKAA